MAYLPLFAYIWLVFMVNVGKYTIHGWYWYPCHLPLLQSASRYAERFPLQVIAAFMAGYHADLEAMDQLGACHFRRFLNMWNLRGYETRNKHWLATIDKDHQTETLIFCPYFSQLHRNLGRRFAPDPQSDTTAPGAWRYHEAVTLHA